MPGGDTEGLRITYPLHGECVGAEPYVRGFVVRPRNASGAATVLVDGEVGVASIDGTGAFFVRLPAQVPASPTRRVEIAARYPDGQSISKTLSLEGCGGPAGAGV